MRTIKRVGKVAYFGLNMAVIGGFTWLCVYAYEQEAPKNLEHRLSAECTRKAMNAMEVTKRNLDDYECHYNQQTGQLQLKDVKRDQKAEALKDLWQLADADISKPVDLFGEGVK